MISTAYKAMRVLTATAQLINDLSDDIISDEEWETADNVRHFLEKLTVIREAQSPSLRVTRILNTKLLNLFNRDVRGTFLLKMKY